MNLRSLGLKPKIVIGFGSLLAIIAGMGVVGYRSALVNEQLSQEARLDARVTSHCHKMLEAFLLQRVGTRDVLMGKGNDNLRLYEHGETDFRDVTDELQPMLTTEATRDLYARVEVADTNYTRRNDQVVARYRSGDTDGANVMFREPESKVASDALSDALSDMMAKVEADRHAVLVQQATSNAWTKRLMMILTLAGLTIGSAITFVIAESIVHAIHRMSAMIESVSSNNLVVEDMEVESDDEMGRAAQGLNKMKNSLRCVMLSIASTAENVAGSSREISATATQAADSAETRSSRWGRSPRPCRRWRRRCARSRCTRIRRRALPRAPPRAHARAER